MKNTTIRKETFTRNYAIIEQRYGQLHKEQLGENTKVSNYGYPDIGNNLYADLLPYKDWLRVNNAQRAHENLVNAMVVLFPNAFIGMLVYPRVTVALLYLFLTFRVFHIQGYLSFRGYNKAVASEEFSKLLLLVTIGVSVAASLNLMGIRVRIPVPQAVRERAARLISRGKKE